MLSRDSLEFPFGKRLHLLRLGHFKIERGVITLAKA